ncbi:MAG TPA: hypothetical protein VN666_04845 [Nitrospira sp.]|nr:hypothetical protein [Nitrospira sp.]
MSNLVEAWKDVKYILGGERASKDERQSQPTVVEGGRRVGENANPYLSARRTWNDLMKAQARPVDPGN